MGIDNVLKKADGIKNRALSIFGRKSDSSGIFDSIASLLDSQNLEIYVVRGKSCKLLYTNERASARLGSERPSDRADVDLVSNAQLTHTLLCCDIIRKQFPGLCENCPCAGTPKIADGVPFELQDINGSFYSIKRSTMTWTDGKPATVFTMNDITRDKDINERLYTLAYIDQLTGVPNRQKLKEDFALVADKIAKNEICGTVAMYDLDHFKEINDTYGHNTGDVVLRRLTEHLLESPDFCNSLYRLGGDEFILFMHTEASKFRSPDEVKKYFQDILSTALRAYTLPNIELKCTLSIGATIFPMHGTALSDLLSKADIALYQAKSAGRNQVLFFEDRYHKAKKFKDIYIDIQPILLGSGKTFGYELLDKGQSKVDSDDGSITLSEFNHTLDALGLNDIENNMHYFISYAKQLLSSAVLKNLPKDKFIVQMTIPDKASNAAIKNNIKLYTELRNNGYKLALTGMSSQNPLPELLAVADYCKFAASDTNIVRQKLLIAKNQRVKFIATNINTIKDYQTAKEAGFHLFQGFYFNNPTHSRKTKEISPHKVSYFRLLQLSSTDDYMDFKEICSVISSDVALSYKLLRLLNSAAVGLRHVSSISAAVAYMGEESMKKWIAVLALRGIAEDKPLEIIRMSLIRARFGEILAPCFRMKRNPQQVFMVGMLSLLHIAMDMTQEELLKDIPVSEDIRASILTANGPHSDLLSFFENYEYANWDAVSQFVEENQLDSNMVSDSYIASVKWYSDLTTG